MNMANMDMANTGNTARDVARPARRAQDERADVGLASVKGDERACGAASEQVDENAQGECEQALRDPLGETAEGLGEGIFERHRTFEVGEHGLVAEREPGLGDFPGGPSAELGLSGAAG